MQKYIAGIPGLDDPLPDNAEWRLTGVTVNHRLFEQDISCSWQENDLRLCALFSLYRGSQSLGDGLHVKTETLRTYESADVFTQRGSLVFHSAASLCSQNFYILNNLDTVLLLGGFKGGKQLIMVARAHKHTQALLSPC